MNPTLRVRIDRIGPEGDGIGTAEGSQKIVFVPYSIPQDRLEARPIEEKGRFLRALPVKIVEPGPHRVEPPCPYHFTAGKREFCGGCDWQHADYETQLALKREIVLDGLKRIAKLDCPVAPTLASPEPWRYRNKVQIPFQPGHAEKSPRSNARSGPSASNLQRVSEPLSDARVHSNGSRRLRAGFYMPGSHRIVEFEDCLVQPELSIAIFKTVRELAESFRWAPYDEEGGRGWLRHLYLRTNQMNEALVVFVTRTPEFPRQREAVGELLRRHPQIKSVWQNVQSEKTSVILGPRWRKIVGADRMAERIGKLTLEFLPGAFLQVNTKSAELLYRTAEQFLTEGGFKPSLLLDVYSGVGAIALWLAPKAVRVIGIEEFSPAVKDAYHNARRLKIKNAHFVQGQAESALRRMKGLDGPRPWAAVLDPPRAGCEPGVLNFLASRRLERVVYVSCDPATFARDAQRLAAAGYRLKKIQPVDLFPQTAHVELVAQFETRVPIRTGLKP